MAEKRARERSFAFANELPELEGVPASVSPLEAAVIFCRGSEAWASVCRAMLAHLWNERCTKAIAEVYVKVATRF